MEIIRKRMKSKFVRSFLLVTGGTAFAQFLGTIVSPIITRLYSPEDYGVLTVYTAILMTFSLAGFSYEKGIPIAEDEEVAANVMVLSVAILIAYTIILLIATLIFFTVFLTAFDANSIYNYRFLIPLGVLLTGIYRILQQWAYRNTDFKGISQTTMTQSFFGNSFKVIGGLVGLNALGLILGTIISQSAGIARLLKPIYQKQKEEAFISKVSLKKMIYSAKRYKDFPLFSAPVIFIHKFDQQIPIIFIASYFGGEVVGFYGLAYSITKLPSKLIGTSIGNVFYAEAAKVGRKDPKRIKDLSNKIIVRLFLVGLIPFIILVVGGPYLFSFVFGSQWFEAGVYARIISIMVLSHLVFSPVSRVYEVYEKQKIALALNIFKTILIIGVFGLAKLFNLNSYLSILTYSITMSVISLINYIIANKIIKCEMLKRNNEVIVNN